MEKIAVFFDYQNVHLTGHSLFGGGCELYRCVPDPVRLADLIAGRRKRASSATMIRVYRGRPDPNHQRLPAAANDAQASQWSRDPRVQMIRRQLNYRDWPTRPPREKGIDVALAVDLMHLAFGKEYDALGRVLKPISYDAPPAGARRTLVCGGRVPCRTARRGGVPGDWCTVPHAEPVDQNQVTGRSASANVNVAVCAS